MYNKKDFSLWQAKFDSSACLFRVKYFEIITDHSNQILWNNWSSFHLPFLCSSRRNGRDSLWFLKTLGGSIFSHPFELQSFSLRLCSLLKYTPSLEGSQSCSSCYQLEQWFSIGPCSLRQFSALVAHQNPLGSFANTSCLCPASRNLDSADWDASLDTRMFEILSVDADVQPR